MNDFFRDLEFFIQSGPLNVKDQGYLLSKWMKQVQKTSNELGSIGKFFPSQFQTDLNFFKKEISKSARGLKNYILEIRKLQNNGIYNEELIDEIRNPFNEIKNHLDNLSNDFLDFRKFYDFAIENENIIFVEPQIEHEIESTTSEQIQQPDVTVLTQEVTNENKIENAISEQIQESEPVALVMETQTQFIRLDIPLKFLNFHGISLYSFQSCGNKTSIELSPTLGIGYNTNGWFINVDYDIKFNVSNILQQKSANLVAISLKKGNYMGKIAYSSTNEKPEYNFSFTSYITTLQKSDVNCSLNFSAQHTNFQLENTSFEIDASSHLGAFNQHFIVHPAISYKIYPFWKTNLSSFSDSSSIHEVNVKIKDSTISEVEVPNRSEMVSMNNFQPYRLEPALHSSNTISKPVFHFTEMSVILLSFSAIGFLIKKIFFKKK